MLNKLLRQMARGGIHSTSALARELQVSQALLAQMIGDLERMGYLRSVGGSCGGGCGACSGADGCAIGGPDGVWMLTENGMRTAGGK